MSSVEKLIKEHRESLTPEMRQVEAMEAIADRLAEIKAYQLDMVRSLASVAQALHKK